MTIGHHQQTLKASVEFGTLDKVETEKAQKQEMISRTHIPNEQTNGLMNIKDKKQVSLTILIKLMTSLLMTRGFGQTNSNSPQKQKEDIF